MKKSWKCNMQMQLNIKTLFYAFKYNVLTRFTEGGKRKTGKLR